MAWRFDALEDEAVYYTLLEQNHGMPDTQLARSRFWRSYSPHRGLYVLASEVCWQYGWKHSELPVL